MPISPQSNRAKYRALGDHACFFVASSRLLFFSGGSKEIPIVDKSRIKMPHHPAGAMERDEANHMIGSGYSSHLLYLANSGGSGQRDRECPSSKWRRGLPPSGPSRAPGGWRDVIAGSLFKKLRSEKRQRKFSSKQHPREREALENAALFSEHSEWPGTEPPI